MCEKKELSEAYNLFEMNNYDLALEKLKTLKESLSVSRSYAFLNFNLCSTLNICSTQFMCETSKSNFEEVLTICHGLPLNRRSVTLETACLWNWTSALIRNSKQNLSSTKERLWSLLNKSLTRTFIEVTRSNSSVMTRDIESTLSYVQAILKYMARHTDCSKQGYNLLFLLMTLNVMWILSEEGFKVESLQVLQLLQNHFNQFSYQDFTVEYFISSFNSIYSILPNLSDLNRLFSNIILGKSNRSQEALGLLSQIKRSNSVHLSTLVNIFEGYGKYDQKEYNEALDKLVLCSRQNLEEKIQSQICNAIGCCLSQMGKPNLSLYWFQRAFKSDGTNVLPMWNVAQQFRVIGNGKAEIEVLILLEKLIKSKSENESSHLEALYYLAKRCMQLDMFQVAANHLNVLLDILSNSGYNLAQVWTMIPCPSFSQIILETAYTCLQSSACDKTINLCNIFVGDFPESTQEMQAGRFRAIRNKLQGTEFNCKNDTLIASMIKANALLKLGHLEDGTDLLKEVQRSVNSFEVTTTEVSEQSRKKPNLDIALDPKSESRLNELWTIISQVSCNRAVLEIRKGHLDDARHLLTVSRLACPGNIDAIYNYILLLAKVGKFPKAQAEWEEAKAKQPNLNTLLQAKSQSCNKMVCSVSTSDLKRLDDALK